MKDKRVLRGILGLVVVFGLGSCGEKESGASGEEGGGDPAPGYVLARPNALPPVGSKVAVSGLLEFNDAPMVLKRGDESMVGTSSTTTQKMMRYEVVSPTKVKILVERDVDTQKIIVGGSPRTEPPKVSPIQGKALTFELRDGSWVASLDSGDELTEEQKEKTESIARLLSSAETLEIYGSGPRMIGEKWDADPNNIPGLGEDSNFTGTFKMFFDRVEEFEGHQCAVLVGTMKVVGTPENAEGLELKMTASVTTYRALEYLEDLKMTIEGEMIISGSPNEGVTMTIRGPFTMKQSLMLLLP
jgi:hypothetical protein